MRSSRAAIRTRKCKIDGERFDEGEEESSEMRKLFESQLT